MIVGVGSAIAAIEGIVSITGTAIEIMKGGIGFTDLPNLMKLLSGGRKVMANGAKAMQEIQDLDDAEAAELGRAVYQASQELLKILAEFKKS
jgi:hypothetical protein